MVHRLAVKLRALGRDNRGLTTVEYAILLCLIVGIAVGTWQKLGDVINRQVGDTQSDIETYLQ